MITNLKLRISGRSRSAVLSIQTKFHARIIGGGGGGGIVLMTSISGGLVIKVFSGSFLDLFSCISTYFPREKFLQRSNREQGGKKRKKNVQTLKDLDLYHADFLSIEKRPHRKTIF